MEASGDCGCSLQLIAYFRAYTSVASIDSFYSMELICLLTEKLT